MKNRIRKFVASMLVFTALSTTNVFADNSPNISVNGEKVAFTDAKPYVDNNGRTMVPIAKIAEIFDAETKWDGKTQKITIKNDFNTIELQIGKSEMLVDGKPVHLDTQPVIKNGRTYVPVKAISQGFGSELGWNDDTQTVTITDNSLIDTSTLYDLSVKGPTFEELSVANHMWRSFDFKLKTNEPVHVYCVIGKKDYVANNPLTADEIIKFSRKNSTNYIGIAFENSYIKDSTMGTTSNRLIIGQDYIAQIVCINEAGGLSEIRTLEFTMEEDPKVITATNGANSISTKLISNNDSLAFDVVTNVPVQFYFVVGKADYMNSNNFSTSDLKKLVDNTTKDQYGRFATDNYFGSFNNRYFTGTFTGFNIPKNVELDSDYVIKIFGVTENGETTGLVTMDVKLKDFVEFLDTTEMIKFRADASQPLQFYSLLGKTEYMNTNNFSVEDLKKLVDNTSKSERGYFETDNYFGMFNSSYFNGTTTGFSIPMNVPENAEYTAKIFGVTESGEIILLDSTDLILKSASK